METLGLGLFFEDLPLGRSFMTIGRTITETDIINFVTCTGMTEVLFTNFEFQKEESDIKGRVCPGALVFAFIEGLLVHASTQHTGFAFLEMSFEIKGPTVAGDTIHAEVEVIESRRSKSRPTRGLVRTRNRVLNQRGDVVLLYTPLRMVQARTDGRRAAA
jgi:acyl dehydratase